MRIPDPAGDLETASLITWHSESEGLSRSFLCRCLAFYDPRLAYLQFVDLAKCFLSFLKPPLVFGLCRLIPLFVSNHLIDLPNRRDQQSFGAKCSDD